MSVVALIPAAGRGTRMGGERPKQFLPLAGSPMLAKTLGVFQRAPAVDEIVVMVPPGEEAYCRETIVDRFGFSKVRAVLAGGATRQASVAAGLSVLGREVSIVVIHDGARPFVSEDLIARVIEAARTTGAAIAALPIVDTLKQSQGGRAVTVEREGLWAAQTPQAFRREVICAAVERALADGFGGTDDAALVERLGLPVVLVEGHPANFKITRTRDLEMAEEMAAVRDRAAGAPSGAVS